MTNDDARYINCESCGDIVNFELTHNGVCKVGHYVHCGWGHQCNPIDGFTLKEYFDICESIWKHDTKMLSSTTQITDHWAYNKVIKLGWIVIPLIFESIKKESAFWFHALRAITGENPIKDEMKGYIDKMTQAWLDWGKENGYIK